MSENRAGLNNVLEIVLALTEEALGQARIDHADALRVTLARRERALARLWGFPEDQPLPEFRPELADLQRIGLPPLDRDLVARLQSVDENLQIALKAGLRRISSQRQELNSSGRLAQDMKNLYDDRPQTRYFDRVG